MSTTSRTSTKTCSACGQIKPDSEFDPDPKGGSATCMGCVEERLIRIERHRKNSDRLPSRRRRVIRPVPACF